MKRQRARDDQERPRRHRSRGGDRIGGAAILKDWRGSMRASRVRVGLEPRTSTRAKLCHGWPKRVSGLTMMPRVWTRERRVAPNEGDAQASSSDAVSSQAAIMALASKLHEENQRRRHPARQLARCGQTGECRPEARAQGDHQ